MASLAVLSDFDGTISKQDVLNNIIKDFAAPGWEKYEQAYKRDEISAQDLYEGIFPLIEVTKKELESYIRENFLIDECFNLFVEYCDDHSIPLAIVSDGLDFYVEILLGTVGLANLKYYSNRLHFNEGEVYVDFPYADIKCKICGNCKRNIYRDFKKNYDKVIYIGDGYSDRCVAGEADIVFAKDKLEEYCLAKGIEYIPYDSFNDILKEVKKYK